MKHITLIIASLLFILAFTLTNEAGDPCFANLLCFAGFALVSMYADRKGWMNGSNEA